MRFSLILLMLLALSGLTQPVSAGYETCAYLLQKVEGRPLQGTVTLEKAKELFKWIKGHERLALDFCLEDCEARVHEISALLEIEGYYTQKIFAEGYLVARDVHGKRQEWEFHVAPVVFVATNSDGVRPMVLDHTLAHEPIAVEEWLSRCGVPKAEQISPQNRNQISEGRKKKRLRRALPFYYFTERFAMDYNGGLDKTKWDFRDLESARELLDKDLKKLSWMKPRGK